MRSCRSTTVSTRACHCPAEATSRGAKSPPDLFGDRGAGLVVDVGDDDDGTLGRGGPSLVGAHASARSGDDHHPVIEAPHDAQSTTSRILRSMFS